MKLSKSAAGILSARYKSVLIKCLLANLMLFSLPATAETIPNGTYANKTFDSPDDYLIEGGTFENSSIDASDDITVSAGTFTESELHAGNDITISDGTFTDSEIDAQYKITISRGQFTYSTFRNQSFSAITIADGTFTNSSFNSYGNLIINGGNIEGTLLVERSPDISIDSDAAFVNLTWDKTSAPLSLITAKSLIIKGKRGIFVSNTAFDSRETSGTITANSNSFLGRFWGTGDYVYHIDGKTLHTAAATSSSSYNVTQQTIFSDATIVLNGDSVAGSGYYSMSFDLRTPPPEPRPPMESPPIVASFDLLDPEPRPYSLTAENAPLQILREELTQDEIDTAIDFIWNDVNKANDENDLTDFTKAVLGSILSGSNAPPPSITDIKEHETAFKTLLTEHYGNFNLFLKATPNTNVIISNNSTFVLNDNAKLINDSFSSDYHEAGPYSLPSSSITTFGAGNITVTSSTVIAKGNNELSARSGNVIFQNSTLKVAENAVLTFSSAGGALLLDP